MSDPIKKIITPMRLDYRITPGHAQTPFLRGLVEGKFLAQRCPKCAKVYIPPRGSCPTCAVPTEEEVETFCNTVQGSNMDAIVVVGDSCRKELGADGGALECKAVQDGKTWFGYGVPGGICLSVIPTDEGTTAESAQGPFCDSY